MIELAKKLGLKENEAKVYLALLELGPSAVTEISKKAEINRTTGYDILERLANYQLIAYVSGKGVKKKYAARGPKNLLNFFSARNQKYQKRLSEFESLLPELELLYKTKEKPVIKFFENIKGIKSIYFGEGAGKNEDLPGEVLSIIDYDSWDSSPELKGIMDEYIRGTSREKWPEKILALPTKKSVERLKSFPTSAKKKMAFRFLPTGRFFPFGMEINIFNNVVVCYILKSPHQLALRIDSESFAATLRILFIMAWEGAQKYNSKNQNFKSLK